MRSPARQIADLILILVFAIGISLPAADMALGLDVAAPRAEKRQLARFPVIQPSVDALTKLPKQIKEYLTDRFGFRNSLIRWHGMLMLNGLGVSPSDQVLVGRNGWLYTTDSGVINDHRGANPFTREQLEQWRQTLDARHDWLEARGVRYVVIFTPNKHTVYPEHLPGSITRVSGLTRLDQLVAYLQAHSQVPIIDVRDGLMDAKDQYRLYHRTDTHWNEIGAYHAYRQIMGVINQWFDTPAPVELSDLALTPVDSTGGDLAGMMGLRDVMSERWLFLHDYSPQQVQNLTWLQIPEMAVNEQPDKTLPRAVMFRDSFAESLRPFLARHFQRLVDSRVQKLDTALVEAEKPDLVIHQIVERILLRQPPRPEPQIIAQSLHSEP